MIDLPQKTIERPESVETWYRFFGTGFGRVKKKSFGNTFANGKTGRLFSTPLHTAFGKSPSERAMDTIGAPECRALTLLLRPLLLVAAAAAVAANAATSHYAQGHTTTGGTGWITIMVFIMFSYGT